MNGVIKVIIFMLMMVIVVHHQAGATDCNEPNNFTAQATVICTGQEIAAGIDDPGDADYYRITCTKGMYYQFGIGPVPEDCWLKNRVTVMVTDPAGQPLSVPEAFRFDAWPYAGRFRADTDGDYFLRVTGTDSAPVPYILTVAEKKLFSLSGCISTGDTGTFTDSLCLSVFCFSGFAPEAEQGSYYTLCLPAAGKSSVEYTVNVEAGWAHLGVSDNVWYYTPEPDYACLNTHACFTRIDSMDVDGYDIVPDKGADISGTVTGDSLLWPQVYLFDLAEEKWDWDAIRNGEVRFSSCAAVAGDGTYRIGMLPAGQYAVGLYTSCQNHVDNDTILFYSGNGAGVETLTVCPGDKVTDIDFFPYENGIPAGVQDFRDVLPGAPGSSALPDRLYRLDGRTAAGMPAGVYLEVRNGQVGKTVILRGTY